MSVDEYRALRHSGLRKIRPYIVTSEATSLNYVTYVINHLCYNKRTDAPLGVEIGAGWKQVSVRDNNIVNNTVKRLRADSS